MLCLFSCYYNFYVSNQNVLFTCATGVEIPTIVLTLVSYYVPEALLFIYFVYLFCLFRYCYMFCLYVLLTHLKDSWIHYSDLSVELPFTLTHPKPPETPPSSRTPSTVPPSDSADAPLDTNLIQLDTK